VKAVLQEKVDRGQKVATIGMKEPPQLFTIGHKNLSASTFTINVEKDYGILVGVLGFAQLSGLITCLYHRYTRML